MENNEQPSVWVIIPAFNEEKVIGRVVNDIRATTQNVVAIDDASLDATGEEAEKNGAIVLRHRINRGQGAALQTGTQYALEQGAGIIIHFDADGQHQGADIPRFIGPILRGDVDVVLGSRFLSKRNDIPLLRSYILKLGILFTWFYSGIKLTDTHNGFRAFSAVAATSIRITENRMAHASEILHEIARQKLKCKEVPVSVLYTEYSLAKGQPSSHAVRIAGRLIWKTLF